MGATITQKTVTLDNIITSTWYGVKSEIIDNVFGITPFYDKMVEAGRIKEKVPDGTHFEITFRYAKMDQNVKWFGRGDTFGKAEKETITRMLVYVKNLGTSMVRFWDDEIKARGKAKILSWIDELVTNTKMSLVDTFETALLVQDNDPNAIDALPTLISTTPTSGTVQGKDRSTNSFMTNQTLNFSGLTTDDSLLSSMSTIYNKASEYKSGTKRSPDLILTTRRIYQDYERVAQALQTIVTNKTERASLGFGELMYKNTEMFYAPGLAEGHMYFLNTENLEFDYDPAVWFDMTEWKTEANSLDRVAQILCRCNLCVNNFMKHGVIYNISPTSD